jgi:hypothetical protein
MTDSVTTEAPTTPMGAARIVPMTITATASAPGTRRGSAGTAGPWTGVGRTS